jgi:hypothetical protein
MSPEAESRKLIVLRSARSRSARVTSPAVMLVDRTETRNVDDSAIDAGYTLEWSGVAWRDNDSNACSGVTPPFTFPIHLLAE